MVTKCYSFRNLNCHFRKYNLPLWKAVLLTTIWEIPTGLTINKLLLRNVKAIKTSPTKLSVSLTKAEELRSGQMTRK
jgi:hypothetical protein